MCLKGYVEVGATTACCIWLITKPWEGSRHILIGYSWFGSLNSEKELMNRNGLYVIMLQKPTS